MKKGEETRVAILNEALAVASVAGLNGLSIGGLATRAGLSKSGLFAHFGSKGSLQIAVVREMADRFTRHVVRPALREASAEGRLRVVVEQWLSWAHSQGFPGGCPLVAATVEFDDQPGPIRDLIHVQQQAWFDFLSRLARKAIQEGSFRPDLDLPQFAFEFNAIGLGQNFGHRALRDKDSVRRARQAFERVIDDARV